MPISMTGRDLNSCCKITGYIVALSSFLIPRVPADCITIRLNECIYRIGDKSLFIKHNIKIQYLGFACPVMVHTFKNAAIRVVRPERLHLVDDSRPCHVYIYGIILLIAHDLDSGIFLVYWIV